MSSESASDDDDFVNPPPRPSKPPPRPPERNDAGLNDSLNEFRSRFNFNSTVTVQKSMTDGPRSSSFKKAQNSPTSIKTHRQKVDNIMDSSRIKKETVRKKDTRKRKFKTDGWSRECQVPCGFTGCNWYYRTKYYRDQHYTVHVKEKPFRCEECPEKSFKTEGLLKEHKNKFHVTATNAVYKCFQPQCSRLFRLRSHYREHCATHLDLQPHVCRICQKSFQNNSQLQWHARTHRDLVSCKYCERLFSATSVKRHEARHEQKNNFFCELCAIDCQRLEDRFIHNQSEGHKSKLAYSELSPIPVTDVNLMKNEIIVIYCGPDDYPRWKNVKMNLVGHVKEPSMLRQSLSMVTSLK